MTERGRQARCGSEERAPQRAFSWSPQLPAFGASAFGHLGGWRSSRCRPSQRAGARSRQGSIRGHRHDDSARARSRRERPAIEGPRPGSEISQVASGGSSPPGSNSRDRSGVCAGNVAWASGSLLFKAKPPQVVVACRMPGALGLWPAELSARICDPAHSQLCCGIRTVPSFAAEIRASPPSRVPGDSATRRARARRAWAYRFGNRWSKRGTAAGTS